jgi:hypothetical protein
LIPDLVNPAGIGLIGQIPQCGQEELGNGGLIKCSIARNRNSDALRDRGIILGLNRFDEEGYEE